MIIFTIVFSVFLPLAVMGEYKGIWVCIVGDYQNSRRVFLCFGVWHRIGVCILCESSCLLKIHISSAFIETLFSLLADMRNEDIAEAMRQMELNFKQHIDTQFAVYTEILE